MDSRIEKTVVKYKNLLDKYNELKKKDLDENSIRIKLGLTPVQFHALKNRETTSEAHNWNRKEEEQLFNLFKEHGTNWKLIRDILSEKIGFSFTKEQVKNKLYAIRKRPDFKERFQSADIPKAQKGRPPKKDCQRHRPKRPPPPPQVSEILTPLNPLEPLDPFNIQSEPPQLQQFEIPSIFSEPTNLESNNSYMLSSEGFFVDNPLTLPDQPMKDTDRPFMGSISCDSDKFFQQNFVFNF